MKAPKKPITKVLVSLLIFSSLATSASAAITFNQIDSTSASVSVSSVTFTTTSSSVASGDSYIIVDNFFTSDSSAFGTLDSGFLRYSVNGGPSTTMALTSRVGGQFNANIGDVSPRDLILASADIVYASGDAVTFELVDFVYSSTDLSIPTSAPSYSAFMIDSGGTTISDTVIISAVPEPSSSLLIGLGMVSLLARRKKTS